MKCHAKEIFNADLLLLLIYCFIYSSAVSATQYSVISGFTVRSEYNDNIFLTAMPQGVSNIDFNPMLKMAAKEENWESSLEGKLSSKKYSDHNLDGNNQYLNLASNYRQERNIYSITGTYNKNSNLSPESIDFGLAARRVNRKTKSLAPQYQRLITERLIFSTSYTRTSVDYMNALPGTYLPYNTNALTWSFRYDLTERDKLSILQQTTDYASKNDKFKYHLVVSQVGLVHSFSKTLISNISIGRSRRNTSNKLTQSINFFGQTVIVNQVQDYTDKGSVYYARITKKFQTATLSAGLSKNDDANSFGGLNTVNSSDIKFNKNISSLWRYNINARYRRTTSVIAANASTNSDIVTVQPSLTYNFDRDLSINMGYRYLRRKFDSGVAYAQHSNMIYIAMSYNFPDISTY